MTLQHALLLKKFHLSCAYRYSYPVVWQERMNQIENLIKTFQK